MDGDPDKTIKLYFLIGDCETPDDNFSIKDQLSANDAKCGIDNLYNTIAGNYLLTQCKAFHEFLYYNSEGINLGTQLYNNTTLMPIGAFAAGFYLYKGSLDGPTNIDNWYLDPNNTAYNVPDDWYILEVNSSGQIASLTQYNTITCL